MASRGDIDFQKVQPKLFEDWLTIPFEDSLDKTPKYIKHKTKGLASSGKFPVVDQGDSLISGYIQEEDNVYKGKMPVIIFGDHTRILKYIDFTFAVGADGTKILKPNNNFNSKFFYYYLNALSIPDLGYSRHFKILKEVKIPLPPRSEQDRIVAKVDVLMAQVATMQKSLERIPQLLKDFRQQVLTQAVTGKLTEEWREGKIFKSINLNQIELRREQLKKEYAFKRRRKSYRHKLSVLPDIGNQSKGINELFEIPKHWKWITLDQVIWNVSDGPHYSPKYVKPESGKRFISMRNVSFNGINFSDSKYVSIEDHNKFIERGRPEKGDILYTKGGTTGIACLVGDDSDFSYWVHVALLKPISDFIDSKFIRNTLSSSLCYKQAQALTHGVSNQDLGLTRMIYICFPLPPLSEQQETVRRIESLFKKADDIEAKYKTLKTKIDTLPQAILHKAFKGELVEQLPTDGDFKELLREIKQLNTKKNTAK